MPKLSENTRKRESTSIRDNEVHKLFHEITKELGELSFAVSKNYIYERIKEKTKLSTRTISFIINHTKPTNIII